MSRLEPLNLESLDPADRRIIESISGSRRGGLAGPFSVLAHNPRVAAPADALHNVFRLGGRLDRRLFELMICTVAREHETPYAWELHARLAQKAGLASSVLVDLLAGRAPTNLRNDEQLVYDLSVELLKTKKLSDDRYRVAVEMLGTERLVEVIAAVGFYAMLCLVLNSFNVPASDGFSFDRSKLTRV